MSHSAEKHLRPFTLLKRFAPTEKQLEMDNWLENLNLRKNTQMETLCNHKVYDDIAPLGSLCTL